MTTANVILGSGSGAVTIHTTKVTEKRDKKLFTIEVPTTPQNQNGTSKPSKIIDLLRVKAMFTMDGYVESATDRQKLINLQDITGTVNMAYLSTNFQVAIESLSITKTSTDIKDTDTDPPSDFFECSITCIQGENIQ